MGRSGPRTSPPRRVDGFDTTDVLDQPRFLSLLAGAYGNALQSEKGLVCVSAALATVKKTGYCWSESELHGLKGQLLLQQSPCSATEAESCFNQAVSITQNQSSKSWELSAATSLARLWQQGKRDEARELLASVYEWFTEGFDTADLIDAKQLLNELSPEMSPN